MVQKEAELLFVQISVAELSRDLMEVRAKGSTPDSLGPMRKATPDDAQLILDFLFQLHSEGCRTIRQIESLPSLEDERKWLEKKGSDKAVVYVALIDGLVVGLIDATIPDGLDSRHSCEIGMSVLASHRNQGIGRQLMEAVFQWARKRRLEFVELSVFSINQAAIHLYESAGFVENDRRIMAVELDKDERCDLLYMSKSLRSK